MEVGSQGFPALPFALRCPAFDSDPDSDPSYSTRSLYSDSLYSFAVLIPLVYLAFLCAPPCHLRSSSVSERSPQTTQHILY